VNPATLEQDSGTTLHRDRNANVAAATQNSIGFADVLLGGSRNLKEISFRGTLLNVQLTTIFTYRIRAYSMARYSMFV
jgi:hypothetical protein